MALALSTIAAFWRCDSSGEGAESAMAIAQPRAARARSGVLFFFLCLSLLCFPRELEPHRGHVEQLLAMLRHDLRKLAALFGIGPIRAGVFHNGTKTRAAPPEFRG